ncbi:hypothetical protein GEMRC1_003473 [Eukaryota sp. GEM-RC1]
MSLNKLYQQLKNERSQWEDFRSSIKTSSQKMNRSFSEASIYVSNVKADQRSPKSPVSRTPSRLKIKSPAPVLHSPSTPQLPIRDNILVLSPDIEPSVSRNFLSYTTVNPGDDRILYGLPPKKLPPNVLRKLSSPTSLRSITAGVNQKSPSFSFL